MNPIERLQADVYGYLRADDYFATVNVLQISEQQLDSDIDSQVALFVETAGKNGASIAIHLPAAQPGPDNVAGPEIELGLEIFISVNKLLNEGADGTGISEGDLICRVLQDLHHLGVGPASLLVGSPAAEPFFKGDGVMVHRLTFKQRINLPVIARVKQPTILNAAGTITLSCATGGATIRYTTDGTFPGTAATAYTAPFATPATGTLLRVCAHKAGNPPSNLSQVTV